MLAAVLAILGTWRIPVQPDLNVAPKRHPLDFRPVFRNRKAVGYMLAYGGHCWELFAFRTWLPTPPVRMAPVQQCQPWVNRIAMVDADRPDRSACQHHRRRVRKHGKAKFSHSTLRVRQHRHLHVERDLGQGALPARNSRAIRVQRRSAPIQVRSRPARSR